MAGVGQPEPERHRAVRRQTINPGSVLSWLSHLPPGRHELLEGFRGCRRLVWRLLFSRPRLPEVYGFYDEMVAAAGGG